MSFSKLQSYSTEDEYRADAGSINYSRIKDMIGNPRSLVEESQLSDDINTKSFLKIGILVDTLLTEPEKVDELFYNKSASIPTAQLYDLASSILDDNAFYSEYIDNMQEYVLARADHLQLWGSVKDPIKRIKKFDNEVFWNYLDLFKEANGRMILNESEFETANKCVMLLTNHEYTKDLFNINNKNVEVVNQFKYRFKFNGTYCRVMLDKIIVNHKDKTILPIDIKTGFDNAQSFKKTFLFRRYDLQSSLYKEALIDLVKNNESLSGYKILDFRFVYISTSNPQYPLRWRVNNDVHNMSINGWETKSGYNYKGLTELIEEFNWRIDSNIFDRDKDIVDNNGEIELLIL